MAITQLPPLSLYIHTPWCIQKCPYCDFNSHQLKTDIPQQAYIDRLIADLEMEMPSVWGRQLSSIFIGGGTPSLFSASSIDNLLARIRALLPFHRDMEITMEANPGTAEADKFKGFFDAGVNRLSIGVQSFNPRHLQSLGRIHDGNEARNAYHIARQAGFKNINLDLMYALPQQSLAQAIEDLQIAIDLAPEHLSWYQLTMEPNTLFYHQPPPLPDNDLLNDIAEQGLAFLTHHDFQRYEVSAFSRGASQPSQHNLNYWQFGDYLGIGAGAHQKITRADTQTITRKTKRKSPKDYLDQNKSLTFSEQVIPTADLPLEFMMNALRLPQGFSTQLFFETTGLLISEIEPALKQGESKKLLEISNNNIRTSELGFQFLNETLSLFMAENFPQLTHSHRQQLTLGKRIDIQTLSE